MVQQLVNGLALGSVYALIALGYTMVYGVLRIINFAHGDVYMLGAFVGYYTAARLHAADHPSFLGGVAVLLAAMLVCACVGMAIERFAYRPLRHSPRINALITAIGVSLLLEYGGQMVFGVNAKSFTPIIADAPVLELSPAFRHGPRPDDWLAEAVRRPNGLFSVAPAARYSWDLSVLGRPRLIFFSPFNPTVIVGRVQVLILCVSVVLMVALTAIVKRTRIGRAMRAVSWDMRAAALMGINIDTVMAFTFAFGSALAAAAAVLYASYNTKIDPLMGILPGLKAFVAAVLGGIGNIPGAMLGGVFMGLAETAVVAFGKSTLRDAIAFSVLILVLLVRPRGLLGSVTEEKV